jgi:hypothetical protein
MEFPSTRYYFIRPRQRLIERVREYEQAHDVELMGLFLPPELWSKRKKHSLHWDEPNLLKAMFIAEMYSEYLTGDFLKTKSPKVYDFLVEILGLGQYNLQTFDQWWKIEYLGDGLNAFDVLADQLQLEVLRKFSETGDPTVDNWIKSEIKKKESAS